MFPERCIVYIATIYFCFWKIRLSFSNNNFLILRIFIGSYQNRHWGVQREFALWEICLGGKESLLDKSSNIFPFLTMRLTWKIRQLMNDRNWYVFQKQNQKESSKRHETQMTTKLAVRVFKQASDETIMRSWGYKLLQYQIIICIPSCTISSNNSDNDNDNNDNNHGVPTLSRDRLRGKGSFNDNDNYTDRHRRENQLPSLVPRMNER